MIVITVPHAKPHVEVSRDEIGLPYNDVAHWCDWLAEPGARLLHQKVAGSVLLIGDINRTTSDLNRKESRDTEFRKNLGKVLKNADVNFLVDMHSADGNFFGNEKVTIVEKDIRAWADYQIAGRVNGKSVIRMPKTISGANAKLVKDLNNAGIGANIVSAWPNTLDILTQASKNNVPAMLIELNEEQYSNFEELNRTIDVIAKWANELNNQ